MFKDTKAFSSFSVQDLAAAKHFYEEILGLTVTEDEMGFLNLHLSGGGLIMVYPKGDAHKPANFTILNFLVSDIEKTVDTLIEKGVKFEQYTGELQTDEKGIARNTGGPVIAWFTDPSGNILSVMEDTSSR